MHVFCTAAAVGTINITITATTTIINATNLKTTTNSTTTNTTTTTTVELQQWTKSLQLTWIRILLK